MKKGEIIDHLLKLKLDGETLQQEIKENKWEINNSLINRVLNFYFSDTKERLNKMKIVEIKKEIEIANSQIKRLLAAKKIINDIQKSVDELH